MSGFAKKFRKFIRVLPKVRLGEGARTYHPRRPKASSKNTMYRAPGKSLAQGMFTRNSSTQTGRRGRDKNMFEDEKLSYKHGKSMKLSQGFINKVKTAASNFNCLILKAVNNITQTKGLGTYTGTPLLYGASDIYNLWVAIGSANVSQRFVIDGVSQTNLITNNDNSVLNCRVYECEARYDIPNPNSSAAQTPIAQLVAGFTESGYTNAMTDTGSTAFQSSDFVCHWKVNSVKLLKFQPGEQKTFTLADKSPQSIYIPRWFQGVPGSSTGILNGLRKRSRFLLYQFWGSPALDSASLTHIGLTGLNVSVHSTVRYDYRWSQDYDNTSVQGTATMADGTQVAPYIISASPTFIETLTGSAVTETPA